jgi:L-histidine Nalpha-methyltransferase
MGSESRLKETNLSSPATAPVPFEATDSSASSAASALHSVAQAVREGLTSTPRTLPPWLFYDERGSQLFEQITALPEYYLTRTERSLFAAHADEIVLALGYSDQSGHSESSNGPHTGNGNGTQFSNGAPFGNGSQSGNGSKSAARPITLAELGAGTAAKTGLLLRALTRLQPEVLYQPIDISPSALEHACATLERSLPAVRLRPQVANYITDPVTLHRPPAARILALYIGSSIGNFSPAEARAILRNLRSQLQPGDALLLGADLAPSPSKPVELLLAAYNDAAGVTAAFNRNLLARLNRDLGADFDLGAAVAGSSSPEDSATANRSISGGGFRHRALWNPTHSRIEMHLESLRRQCVHIPANSAGPALTLHFASGETIHTENSYKFTPAALSSLLNDSGFTPAHRFTDPAQLFAVTLAPVA